MAIKFNHNLTKIRDPKTGLFIPLPSMSGPKGDRGLKGDKGDTGDTGPKGDPGKDVTDEQVKASVESYMQNSPELTDIMKKIDELFGLVEKLNTSVKTIEERVTKLEGQRT